MIVPIILRFVLSIPLYLAFVHPPEYCGDRLFDCLAGIGGKQFCFTGIAVIIKPQFKAFPLLSAGLIHANYLLELT